MASSCTLRSGVWTGTSGLIDLSNHILPYPMRLPIWAYFWETKGGQASSDSTTCAKGEATDLPGALPQKPCSWQDWRTGIQFLRTSYHGFASLAWTRALHRSVASIEHEWRPGLLQGPPMGARAVGLGGHAAGPAGAGPGAPRHAGATGPWVPWGGGWGGTGVGVELRCGDCW